MTQALVQAVAGYDRPQPVCGCSSLLGGVVIAGVEGLGEEATRRWSYRVRTEYISGAELVRA